MHDKANDENTKNDIKNALSEYFDLDSLEMEE